MFLLLTQLEILDKLDIFLDCEEYIRYEKRLIMPEDDSLSSFNLNISNVP